MSRTFKEKLLESGIGDYAAELINDPGSHGSNIVTAKVNNLTGGIGYLQAGADVIPVQSPRRNSFTVKPGGTFAQSGAGDVTRHTTFSLPKPVVAFRLRLLEAYGALTGITAALAYSANASSLYTPTEAYLPITWAGAGSVNISAPASGSAATAATSVVESDLIFSKSVAVDASVLFSGKLPGAVAMLRTYQPVSQKMSRFDMTDTPTIGKGGIATAYQVGINGVTTPASFNSPIVASQLPPFEMLFYTVDDVRTFAHCGASTVSGQGDSTDNNGRGWAFRACNSITDFAAINANYGFAGQSTVYSLTEAIAHITRTRPNVAAFMPFSANDGDVATAAGDARQICGAIRFVDACRALGVRPMLITAQAWSTIPAEYIASRNAVNNAVRTICALGDADLLEIDSLITPGSVWANAAWTTDGTHPSTLGHQIIADYAKPIIQQSLALS